MLKVLLLMLIFTVPSYSQRGLSPEAKLLVQQAQAQNNDKTPNRSLGFNVGVTTRFDGGVTFPLYGFDVDFSLFNVTALEFYIPVSKTTQFLASFRFSTPTVEDYYNDYDGLYKMRLGFGLGAASTLFDRRNSLGVGMLVTSVSSFAMEYMFLNDDLDRYENYTLLGGSYVTYRFETGVRYNYFIHKNLAFVVGFETGIGLVTGYQSQRVDTDGYPIEPLEAYGAYGRGIYTFGITVGLMF